MPAIRVLHIGLGPIGSAVVREVSGRKGFRIVGGVDIDAAKVGRDVGEVARLGRPLGVNVSADISAALKKSRPTVVVLCTSSSIDEVLPQIAAILKTRTPIVSTAEELAYPFFSHQREARLIDTLAKKARVGVLGAGVNPGFVMDVLPIVLTAACSRVDGVRVHRVQDARTRRLPFQQKIGVGLSREQFRREMKHGAMGHVGMTQSIAMIAAALGWTLDRVTDRIEPKIATATVESELLAVDAGYVSGLVQEGVGFVHGKPVVSLHFEAYLGAPESLDSVEIDGSPALTLKIAGGVPGDAATASIVVNSIAKLLAAAPGLHTMRSLPLPSFFGGR